MSTIRIRWGFILLCLTLSAGAVGAQRQAYKHVDENGNVTYSQVPPSASGTKDSKVVDISPANQGRGRYVSSGRPASSYYPSQPQTNRHHRSKDQVSTLGPSQTKEAKLQAECERNRGADCKNPDVLRQMENQNIPRTTPRQVAR